MKKMLSFTLAPLVLLFIIAVILTSVLFLSCSKEEKKGSGEIENRCPIITAAAVPQVVKDSFAIRYPSMTVNTWFQKDSIGYCAYFIQSVNQQKLVEFTRTGFFVSEEIDMDHDGNFEDSTGHSSPKIPSVCECEIPE